MTICKHMKFQSAISVYRLTEPGSDEVKGYVADVRIKCSDCGVPMEFLCERQGSSLTEPAASLDHKELRCPLRPSVHHEGTA